MGRIIASMLGRSNLQVLMAKFGGSVQFTPGLSLGNNSAEADDEFLSQCFVTTHAYEQLVSLDTTKMIAAGRTGSGKTAKLLQIKQMHGKIAEIDPVDMSLDFISNSNILQFLQAVGADLDLLFQVLWKHVLCVEYVRLRHSVKDMSAWQRAYDSINNIFGGDPRRAKALNYLKSYNGKFWIPFDESVKEVIEKITKDLEREFSSDYEKFKSKIHYAKGISTEKRAEIIARCKTIVNPEQLKDLSQLVFRH